ncbi:hypothetical protein B0T10DRAFT_195955 [Thelonectria olida]|uniref:Uncharacterized protein n=1 Tax=Thelonectria olida TaxID=1576542 RepID=A0A9P8VV22_9HYPO|nr:hypothetical protein B0T10DRAFT_195889 [Thelonectria olida]KAH6876862.1 hypothetical protein B0T10DRAFT_195955 [Thelonectria olida]
MATQAANPLDNPLDISPTTMEGLEVHHGYECFPLPNALQLVLDTAFTSNEATTPGRETAEDGQDDQDITRRLPWGPEKKAAMLKVMETLKHLIRKSDPDEKPWDVWQGTDLVLEKGSWCPPPAGCTWIIIPRPYSRGQDDVQIRLYHNREIFELYMRYREELGEYMKKMDDSMEEMGQYKTKRKAFDIEEEEHIGKHKGHTEERRAKLAKLKEKDDKEVEIYEEQMEQNRATLAKYMEQCDRWLETYKRQTEESGEGKEMCNGEQESRGGPGGNGQGEIPPGLELAWETSKAYVLRPGYKIVLKKGIARALLICVLHDGSPIQPVATQISSLVNKSEEERGEVAGRQWRAEPHRQ